MGILAVIALLGHVSYVYKSKPAEAVGFLSEIKARQESSRRFRPVLHPTRLIFKSCGQACASITRRAGSKQTTALRGLTLRERHLQTFQAPFALSAVTIADHAGGVFVCFVF